MHRILREHLATFLARTEEQDGPGLPRFVRRELSRYLECGLLAFGFARVHCSRCSRDDLVAFACKGRGFCPSCGARRMADFAAHLVDDVLPQVPIRQWVLSFPYRVRFLLAYDARLCAAVRRILVRVLFDWLAERAEREGVPGGRPGAVVFVQRFGSALNLNLHFHALVLDGVYASPSSLACPVFHPTSPLEDEDVEQLTTTLYRRVVRYLKRRGRLPRREGNEPTPLETDEPLLTQIDAASIQGRVALGPHSGRPVARLGHRPEVQPLFIPGELCCDVDGFSLHAKVEVEALDRERLEHLCRIPFETTHWVVPIPLRGTRAYPSPVPPIATERLSLAPDGRGVYRLRRHWRDGTAAVAFDPLTFIERLAALVPRSRCHLLTYHGVLAPTAQSASPGPPNGGSQRCGGAL